VPALFALAFLPMFGLGGLTGLPLGLAASDIPLHDTYYVIGHFHYIVAPGTLFALFAGIYHWFPRITGRTLNERLGKLHFWGSLVAMNLIFMPMFVQGLAGLNRRLFDGGRQYQAFTGFEFSYELQAWAAVALGVVQIVFVANLILTLTKGTGVGLSKTPGDQSKARAPEFSTGRDPSLSVPPTHNIRDDTNVDSVTLAFWLFIASEVMLFGALFSSYALLRVSATDWPASGTVLNLTLGSANTVLLFLLTTVALRIGRAQPGNRRGLLLLISALAMVFLAIKGLEYRAEWSLGQVPATSTFMAMYWTLTGVHALHVIGGVIANLWVALGIRSVSEATTAGRLKALRRYWVFVDLIWLIIFVGMYLK
jgi:heme/copper-type cytochrome/quinol oxidase subunit 3